MYRRLPGSLPQDQRFPVAFQRLGYKVNEKSQIRAIADPEHIFKFFISNNDRYNELNREAMHSCVQQEVSKRMKELEVPKLFLPHLTTTKPKDNHTAIYATNQAVLKTKSRVVVVIGGHNQELGCWSFRSIFNEPGIDGGSSVSLAKELQRRTDPGLLILNSGQLQYSHELNRSLSLAGWRDRRRKSAVHPEHIFDEVHNRVSGNETPLKHIQFVFEKIISDSEFINAEAMIDIIGILDGGNDILEFFNEHWSIYSPRISAIALVNPWHNPDSITNLSFLDFLEHRGRIWTLSGAPQDTCLAIPSDPRLIGVYKERVSCPTFSGGVADFPECIMVNSFNTIVDWLDAVAKDQAGYKNPSFEVSSWAEEGLNPPEIPSNNSKEELSGGGEKLEDIEPDIKIAGLDVPKSLAEKAGLL